MRRSPHGLNFKAVAAQASAKRDEIDLNLPNFGLVFFDITVSKIRGANNRELGRTIILDDVTERRHAEKRIARQIDCGDS